MMYSPEVRVNRTGFAGAIQRPLCCNWSQVPVGSRIVVALPMWAYRPGVHVRMITWHCWPAAAMAAPMRSRRSGSLQPRRCPPTSKPPAEAISAIPSSSKACSGFEVEATEARRWNGRMRFANFPTPSQLEDFDFSAQPSIDQRLVHELAAGAYPTDATNVLHIGPPGVGKTMLAVILGRAAVDGGHLGSTTPPPLT